MVSMTCVTARTNSSHYYCCYYGFPVTAINSSFSIGNPGLRILFALITQLLFPSRVIFKGYITTVNYLAAIKTRGV